MARLGRKNPRFKRKQVRLLMDIAQPNWLSVHRNGASNVSRHRNNDRYYDSPSRQYLDHGLLHLYN
jgi:hypothetical protein